MPKKRCAWCGDDPLYMSYHDQEWGVPLFDDGRLFEFMILEGAQAGLSWLTILRKRDNYRKAFDGFEINIVARYGQREIRRLLTDPGIVRNRLKIEAAVNNARVVLGIMDAHGSLSDYLWRYVGHKPIQNRWKRLDEIPAATPLSQAMSKDLKKLGCRFVGPTICYAFMQAVGMVNDHTVDCYRHAELQAVR